MIDDNAVKIGALSSVPLEVAWASTILSIGKIKPLTMELKIRTFHRQLFKKSITLLEFCERQAVRILICLSERQIRRIGSGVLKEVYTFLSEPSHLALNLY